MASTSRTGLIASPKKSFIRAHQKKAPHLKILARPAPLRLKPLSGIYNPYPCGCSLLCNHPANREAKELLRKARDTWATEGRNILLAEEVQAIKAGLEQLCAENVKIERDKLQLPQVDGVPEELFRRYTETDSRPLTPAPTLASVHTRASSSRRCVTPDPTPTTEIREKTLLILDLRRSHSQETLAWYGSTNLQQEAPLIRIQQVTKTGRVTPATTISCSKVFDSPRRKTDRLCGNTPRRPKSYEKTGLESAKEDTKNKQKSEAADAEEEDFIKRKGKRRKKRGRDLSGGRSAFQNDMDPETQVELGPTDSQNPSTRGSLIPGDGTEDAVEKAKSKRASNLNNLDFKSYLDAEILKQLRRELNEDVMLNEFNYKRRLALEEAMKTVPPNEIENEELVKLRNELNLPPVNTDLWLTLPRVFTRSSARFELPMNSRTLGSMSPMDYIKNNVSITSARKLLYGCVFKRFRIKTDEEHEENLILGKELISALNMIMGKSLSEKQAIEFRELLGWDDSDTINFKTFCGICSLCERILAAEYCPHMPGKKADPCHEIESADFESLNRRLDGQKVDKRLVKILYAIKDS